MSSLDLQHVLTGLVAEWVSAASLQSRGPEWAVGTDPAPDLGPRPPTFEPVADCWNWQAIPI